MKKYIKINEEAEAETAQSPEAKTEPGKAPAEGEKPKEGKEEGKGLVDINAGPGEVLKAICDFKDGPGPNPAKEEIQKVIKSGLGDGKKEDEIISIEPGEATCSEMIPTQLEIGTSASLDDQILNKFGNLDQAIAGLSAPVMMKSKPFEGRSEFPVLCFRAGGKVYILDGHHRWSQAYATSPNVKMVTAEIKAPGVTDAKQALALCHIILASLYGKSVTKKFEGDNLLAPSKPIDEYIKGVWSKEDEEVPFDPKKRKIGEAKKEVLEKLKKANLIKEENEEEAIQMYVKNCASLKKLAETNPTRFSRIYMPQPGDSGDKTQMTSAPSAAAAGQVNYIEPKKSDVKESKVIKTFEKFMTKWKKGEI